MQRLFGTDGIRGVANEYPLTVEMCYQLARALVVHFNLLHGDHVVIGKDTRESGDIFEHALAAGMASFGVNSLLLGVIPTPAVSIITQKIRASLGIVVSASHNPFYDNGIKIFNKLGLKLRDTEELQIEKSIFEKKEIKRGVGRIKHIDMIDDYVTKIEEAIDIDGRGKKVVVDLANGAMSEVVPKILSKLNFDLIVLNADPNGKNINENCGVTYPKTLSMAVKENNADFGMAFDGDGDRVILCDENGDVMDGNQILALFSASNSGAIVSTIMANYGLEQYLANKGISLIRTNVGDRYISDYMQVHEDVQFGGEPSGHIIIREHALTGDGLFSGLKVIENFMRSGTEFSEFSHVFPPLPSISKNIKVLNKKIMLRTDIDTAIKEYQAQLSTHGRLIVRLSGTEPLIRITAEGNDINELRGIVDSLLKLLETVR